MLSKAYCLSLNTFFQARSTATAPPRASTATVTTASASTDLERRDMESAIKDKTFTGQTIVPIPCVSCIVLVKINDKINGIVQICLSIKSI